MEASWLSPLSPALPHNPHHLPIFTLSLHSPVPSSPFFILISGQQKPWLSIILESWNLRLIILWAWRILQWQNYRTDKWIWALKVESWVLFHLVPNCVVWPWARMSLLWAVCLYLSGRNDNTSHIAEFLGGDTGHHTGKMAKKNQ